MPGTSIVMAMLLTAALWLSPQAAAAADPRPGEITEYQGQKLSPYDRHYDNSIKGGQKIDPQSYRLEVMGLVERPLSLSYPEIVALPAQSRVVNMPCVEGWDERLLFKGVAVAELLAMAGARPQGTTVIFRAADGYSSALPLDYVRRAGVLLAYQVNGLALDVGRGFPLQVVAPHKLGYKWVKWVTIVELGDQPYLGYWERRGYSDEADTSR